MQTRIASILILVEEETADICRLNALLSGFRPLIIGRYGLNAPESKYRIISLIVQSSNEQLGALSGSIGKIPGIRVKTASLTIKT